MSRGALFQRERRREPTESFQGNNQICILVSLFKGHSSILWIQISTEKAYQSNFVLPSTQPNWNEKDYDKSIF